MAGTVRLLYFFRVILHGLIGVLGKFVGGAGECYEGDVERCGEGAGGRRVLDHDEQSTYNGRTVYYGDSNGFCTCHFCLFVYLSLVECMCLYTHYFAVKVSQEPRVHASCDPIGYSRSYPPTYITVSSHSKSVGAPFHHWTVRARMALFPPLLLYGAATWIVYALYRLLGRTLRRKGLPYPPGPPGWPIVGTVQLPSEVSWIAYRQWAKKYGMCDHLTGRGGMESF